MSEDEALQKWCPFARVVVTQLPHPTQAEAKAQTRCIGSACMAWRIAPEFPTTGFCGLAGSLWVPK